MPNHYSKQVENLEGSHAAKTSSTVRFYDLEQSHFKRSALSVKVDIWQIFPETTDRLQFQGKLHAPATSELEQLFQKKLLFLCVLADAKWWGISVSVH